MNRPDVIKLVAQTARDLRGRFDTELARHGLRLAQLQILRLLWDHDGQTPRQLADHLGVEMPTVTRTVGRMVRDGFVRREAHPGDARSVLIRLAARGLEVRSLVDDLYDRFTVQALKHLDEREQAELIDLLGRLRIGND